MAQPRSLSRRSALQLGLGAAGAPFLFPHLALGAAAPSNQLRFAAIGTGRMGHTDLKECLLRGLEGQRHVRLVAVCDVDRSRAEHAAALISRMYGEHDIDLTPTVYTDYRELLDKEDLDGATISTSEHWHALIAIAASRAGVHTYVQKPLTYSVVEGQHLVKAVRENNVVLQTGSQQRSSVYFRRVCEAVRNGRIGTLRRIEAGLPEDHGTGQYVQMPVPEQLDYDLWTGPLEPLPYTEDRVHPRQGFSRPGWLQIERTCRGMITGWGAHMNDIAQWGHGSDAAGLTEIEATAAFPDRGLFNVHTTFEARGKYSDGVELFQHTGRAGVKFIGDDGWMYCARGSMDASDRELLRAKPDTGDVLLPVSNSHMGNFLDCCRSGEDPIAPVEAGHRSNTICVITHIAMKLGRKLQWDPKAERFVGDKEANGLLHYAYRKPWSLT